MGSGLLREVKTLQVVLKYNEECVLTFQRCLWYVSCMLLISCLALLSSVSLGCNCTGITGQVFAY